MCRLLGYVATSPRTVADVLGDGLEEFRHLSRTHGDGWGAAWCDDDDCVASTLVLEPADDSDKFHEFARDQKADAALVHLRRATQGLAVSAANLHPFGRGSVAFAHNGSVLPPQSADVLIPAGSDAVMRGNTDSERIYLAVVGRMQGAERMSALEALVDTLRVAEAELDYTSLNCMMLTPDELLVACVFRPIMLHAFADFELVPDYYEMRYLVEPDSVVVSSSGWRQDGWTVLNNGDVLRVDRRTLATSVHTLHRAARPE